MFDKAILHVDLDAFFVSVECLRNSKFRGKPLIIGGTSARGIVASCSYEARYFGVHTAMPIKMALRLCPDAIVLRGDMDTYSKFSEMVTEVIDEKSPMFEKAAIDEFYIDMTGMDKFVGCERWMLELRQMIVKWTGLPLSVGLSINKLVSKVGTSEAKPSGKKVINAGTEKAFLAPLSVSKLPSVGRKTYKKLSFMGVKTVKTLSNIPKPYLQREFGKKGISLWKKANAIDDTAVIPYHDKQSITSEKVFQEDTINMKTLKAVLTDMVTQLAFDLRNSSKVTAEITVKIRYSDHNTFTKQKRIPYTANDRELVRYAYELFEKLFERRQLIRVIGVKFGHLIHGNLQLHLFNDTSKEVQVLQKMDLIRKRFGKESIKSGGALF